MHQNQMWFVPEKENRFKIKNKSTCLQNEGIKSYDQFNR